MKKKMLRFLGFALVCAWLCDASTTAQAQVVQKPTGVAFDCPATVATPTEGIPETVYIDFYACDPAGNNCAAAAGFSTPKDGLLVTDARLVHVPNTSPATCWVSFTSVGGYPIGMVYSTKGRFVNSWGQSTSSNPSAPFTTPQGAPGAPANWRLWTPPPSP